MWWAVNDWQASTTITDSMQTASVAAAHLFSAPPNLLMSRPLLQAQSVGRRAGGGEARGGGPGGPLASSAESFKSGLASYASLENADMLPPAAPNGCNRSGNSPSHKCSLGTSTGVCWTG